MPQADADALRKKAQEEVVAVSPTSLLPEAEALRPRQELAAISPSELLPPAPQRQLPEWINRRTVGGTIVAVLALVVINFLSSRVELKPVPELMRDAASYLQQDNRTAAVIQLKNVLEREPDHVEARLMHGKLILETGDAKTAEEEFLRAQEVGAKREVVLPLIAQALIARKEYQAALDATAPAPDEDRSKEPPELIAQRGHALLFLGRKNQAREAFDLALSIDPEQPDAHLGLARIAVLDRDQDGAMKSISRAVAKAPNNADALALLADLTRFAGDEPKAAETYEKAVKIAPSNHAMRLSLVSIYIGANEYDKAIKHLEVVLKAVPESATANFLYATIEFRREKYVEARNRGVRVLNVQGNHVPSLLLVGASAFVTNDFPIAEKALRRALALAPGHIYARKLLGASLVRIKQPRQALDELLPLVKRFSKDADLFTAIGEAYLDLGDYSKATEFLERAAAIAPKDASARIGLGRTRLASGELDRAIEDLEAANVLAPQGRTAKLLLAMAHLQRKEFDRAIELIGTMDAKQRTNPVALNLLGGAHVGKQDFRAAMKYFDQALATSPDYMPAVLNLVQLYMREKDARAAVRRLEAVVKHNPNNVDAMFALAAILADIPEEREEAMRWLERAQEASPDSPEPLLQLARYHLGRGAPQDALKAAQRGLELKIHRVEMLDSLGQIQFAAGGFRQALDTYVRMVSEHPKLPLAHFRLGTVQRLTANEAGARQSFRNALALQPTFLEAKVALTQLEVKAGNTSTALKLADEIIQQFPKSAFGLVLKGDVLALSNRFAEAIPVLEAAYAREKNAQLVLKLHQAYAQAGKIESGEKVVDDWLQQQPKDMRTRQIIAEYSMSIKRFHVAQKHYEALAQMMPKNQQVLNNLANIYDTFNDRRALETADQAYQLDTRNPYVADTYAWMLVRLGRPERGRDILKDAITRAPNIRDMRYHYAVALAKTGQRKEARSEIDRAFSLKGSFSYEADAKKLLEELKN